jgi:hypothetical protein
LRDGEPRRKPARIVSVSIQLSRFCARNSREPEIVEGSRDRLRL